MDEKLDITIGFSTTTKWISAIIRWITRSPCSHAWIAFNDNSLDLRLVMQCEWWGFEVRPWERWKIQNILVAEFVPLGISLESSLIWIAKYLGSEYDKRSAFLVGIKKWFGKWIKGRFNSPKKMMCSESVIRFLDRCHYLAVEGLDPELTSPKELLDCVMKQNDEFMLISASKSFLKKTKKVLEF